MQMAVPIFSLPQEWLWCETWCSDATLKTAKTIDLVRAGRAAPGCAARPDAGPGVGACARRLQ